MFLNGQKEVKFQITSGATVNVLPAKYAKGNLKKSDTTQDVQQLIAQTSWKV